MHFAEVFTKEVISWRIPNGPAKSVLVILASHVNMDGLCYPSLARLSELSGFSPRTVQRSIDWCAANGLIIRTSHGRSTAYQFTTLQEDDMTNDVRVTNEEDSNIISITSGSNTNTSSGVRVTPIDPTFDVFWQAYPRRIGKGAARVSFERAKKLASVNEIIQAARAFSQLCQEERREKRYIPHPATWLNQERWEDDIEGEREEQQGGWANALNEL